MKQIFKFLVLLLLTAIFGCSNSEDCMTPPQSFNFELVDKETGVNLFTNKTYDPSQITVKNIDNDKNIDYRFTSENSLNLITVFGIGWKTETVNCSVNISGKSILLLHVEAKNISNDCSYTEYKNIEIKNAEYQLDKTTGIYKILIDTKL